MSGVVESVLAGYRRWLESWGKSVSTIKTYVNIVRAYLESEYGLDTAGVIGFLDRYEGNSRATAFFALRSFYRYLEALGERVDVRWDLIPRRWVEPDRIVLSREQVKRIIDSAETTEEKLIVMLLYDLALRVGELVKLRWRDVRIEDGVCWVDTTRLKKGRKLRIPLAVDTCRTLLEYRARLEEYGRPPRPDDRIIGYTERMIQYIVRRLGRKIGVDNLHPHAFRRARATHLSEDGWSLAEIAELGGWKSIQTLMRYVRIPEAVISQKKIQHDEQLVSP